MDIKIEIKEEPCFLEFYSENERDTKHYVKQVKIETSDCDIKPELADSSCCSQNEEHHLMSFNETTRESETGTQIDIKKEQRWLEREDLNVHDIKVETQEDVYSTKPPSIYKDDSSSDTSALFSHEDLGNDITFSMNKDSPDYERERRRQSQKTIVTAISSPETYDDGKIVSMASSSQQSKFLQQRCANKQDSNDKSCKLILKHSLTLNSKEANKCDVSDQGLSELSSVKTCKLIDEGETKQMCNNFTNLQRLETHKLNNEGINPHKCSICNKTYTQLSYLKKHKLIHEGIKPYKCNICNKAFTQLAYLKTHTLIHEGIKPHKCSICYKAFTAISNLNRHKLSHQDIRAYKCNICNKTFTRSSNLKTHKLLHEGIRPHVCNICDKAFTELSNLKIHKLCHQGIKLHKCNICDKDFTHASHLRKHILIHEGKKPHKCNICDKGFTEQSNLKRHKMTHQSIKPHRCDICSKGFNHVSRLKTHKLIHEGIKPHKCNICNKAFIELSNLKRHKMVHKNK